MSFLILQTIKESDIEKMDNLSDQSPDSPNFLVYLNVACP